MTVMMMATMMMMMMMMIRPDRTWCCSRLSCHHLAHFQVRIQTTHNPSVNGQHAGNTQNTPPLQHQNNMIVKTRHCEHGICYSSERPSWGRWSCAPRSTWARASPADRRTAGPARQAAQRFLAFFCMVDDDVVDDDDARLGSRQTQQANHT